MAVSEPFDAYYKWLGIKPKDQPPNHYRLLGVELFESDADVIDNAAEQRMRHVRSFQNGPNGDASQRILNEIAAAKICLLNDAQRAAYDQTLRAATQPVASPTPVAVPVAGSKPVFPKVGTTPTVVTSPPPLTARAARAQRKKADARVEIAKHVSASIVGLAIAYLILAFIMPGWDGLGIASGVRSLIAGKAKEPVDSPAKNTSNSSPRPFEDTKPAVKPPINPKQGPVTQRGPIRTNETSVLPLRARVQSRVHSWPSDAGPAKPLEPVPLSFVSLSSVRGSFVDNKEWFWILAGNDDWTIHGEGEQRIGISATTIRTPARWLFDDHVQTVAWTKDQPPIKLIHQNDGFAVLSGIHGALADQQQWVQVNLDPDGYWYLRGASGSDTRGQALVFRFRQPGQFRAEVTEHSWTTGQPSVELLEQSEGVCFISKVGGAFKSPGDMVNCQIDSTRKRWVFSGQSQSPSTTASCISIKFSTEMMLAALSASQPSIAVANPATTVQPSSPNPNGKQPRPDEAALAAARASLGTALTTGDARSLANAANQAAGVAEKYVLLLAARDKAIADADAVYCMALIDELTARFEEDRASLSTQAIAQLQQTCNSPQLSRGLAIAALREFDQFRATGSKESQASLAEVSLAVARKSEDVALIRRATVYVLDARKLP